MLGNDSLIANAGNDRANEKQYLWKNDCIKMEIPFLYKL